MISKEQTLLGSLLTLLAYIYNLVSTPIFWILIILSIIEFLLGVYSSLKNKELNRNKFMEMVISTLFIGVLVVISAMIDYLLNNYGIKTHGVFHNYMMGILIAYELGCIQSNADKANLWTPKIIKTIRIKIEAFINSNIDKK